MAGSGGQTLSMRESAHLLVSSELDGSDEDLVQEAILRLLHRLSSGGHRGSRPASEDNIEDLVVQNLLRRKQRDAQSIECQLRFQGLCRRLRGYEQELPAWHRNAVMRVLYSLRSTGDGGEGASPASAVRTPSRFSPDVPLENLNMPSGPCRGGQLSPAVVPAAQAESGSEDVRVGWHVPGVTGSPPVEMLETQLLRDVLHALQGVNSSCFKFQRQSGRFELSAAFVLSRPIWHLTQQILELGALHMQLCEAANAAFETEDGQSLLHQALAEALREQLRDYYRTLALLMAKLDTPPARGAQGAGAGGQLTLRRLWTWLQSPLERMRLLVSLCESCAPLRGGALASAVYGFSRVGDNAAREVCAAILKRVVEPLFAMIRAWMTEGDLRDPFGEYFVCADASVPLEELWTRMYSLDVEMVPCFMTLELARKILLTGKSVNFIRLCCPGQEWLTPSRRTDASIAAPGDPRGSDDFLLAGDEGGLLPLQALAARVEHAALRTNRRLVELLKERYALGDHCLALRRFMLLGQGDFVETLMDIAQEDLDKEAKDVYRHQLMGVLDKAVLSSNAQFCPADTLQRLGVKILQKSAGERGWDVFLLEYAIDAPLHVVFTPMAMKQYDRAFAFLWKLRRVSYSMASCWRHHMALQRHLLWRGREVRAKAPELGLELRQTLHKCTMIRNEMHHFVQNIQSYVMCEVVDSSWSKLQSGWQSCTDLDQVILEHQKYLSCIEEGAFLARRTEAILTALGALFGLALEFASLHDSVCSSAFEALETIAENGRPAPFARSLAECRAQLDQIGGQFSVRLQSLLRTLEGHATSAQVAADLRFLVGRLDFNGYYEPRNVNLRGERRDN